jgi:hypothetical protein
MEKNIHFIVLGSPPDWAQANMDRFAAINPDWTVMAHGYDFPMLDAYKAALDKAVTVGGQSDILRMACLNTFGGWYFDWDVYAIRPIDETKTAAMIGDKLLLWSPPQTNGLLASSICAATKDCKAWPFIHKVIAEIVQDKAVARKGFEYFICAAMRLYHRDAVTFGKPEEFTVTGLYEPDKAVYRHLTNGEAVGSLNECAFLHGWAELSKGSAICLATQE